MSNCNCESSDCGFCGFQNREQEPERLPDMSSEIASMGRGSMARRIAVLERALEIQGEALFEAKEALAGIAADDNTWQGQEAKAALVLIAHMLGGK